MIVRIFQPAKTAMQSGLARTREWVVEPQSDVAQTVDPLMGWTSSGETATQLRLSFPTREEAIAYAERQGYGYVVIEPEVRRAVKRSYADNFKFGRIGSWTH